MLKITVIILASIISAVILQDVNNELQGWGTQLQKQGDPCARQDSPSIVKQVTPSYIITPPQPLPLEKQKLIEPHKPLINNPLIHKPLINEPLIHEPKPEEIDDTNYYNNRRKMYPNPTVQHNSDEIVERSLITDKIPTKDCSTVEKETTGILDPLPLGRSQTKNVQPLDTRRAFRDDGVQNEYRNDLLNENNLAYAPGGSIANNDEIDDPVFRADVSVVSDKNKPLIINNPRVCYACSSATNPTCLEPNKRTTIKYCKKDRASCVTKTFGEGQSLTVIRDCAASCSDSSIPGLEPKYKSCKMCHSDLCNSAFSIKSYKILYVLLLFTAFKFSF